MYSCTGEQGCCSGESTYLPPLWPGFESSVNAIQCTGVKVVVGSFQFSPLLQAKNSKIKFQFDLEHMRSNWNLILELLVWRRGGKVKRTNHNLNPHTLYGVDSGFEPRPQWCKQIMWRKIIAVIYAISYNSSLCSSHIWFSHIHNFNICQCKVSSIYTLTVILTKLWTPQVLIF